MNIRLISAGLWFLAAAYAGSILHGIAGVHELVGPVVGLTTGALIVADPFHRFATGRVSVPVRPAMPAPKVISEPA